MDRLVAPDSHDLVVCVAQIHHHAYLDTPMDILYDATKSGGYIIIADWHNSMWEDPNRVYDFLKDFEWGTKDEDMKALREMFPNALRKAKRLSKMDEASNDRIRSFWRDGYAVTRKEAIEKGEFKPEDDILILEGHRPVERQIKTMKESGYSIDDSLIDENPKQILPDSRILMLTIGRIG